MITIIKATTRILGATNEIVGTTIKFLEVIVFNPLQKRDEMEKLYKGHNRNYFSF